MRVDISMHLTGVLENSQGTVPETSSPVVRIFDYSWFYDFETFGNWQTFDKMVEKKFTGGNIILGCQPVELFVPGG
jgi:hypothetical protein